MKLSRLESLIAEAKNDPAITADTEVNVKVGGATADEAKVIIREAIGFTVGEGIPALKPSVPGSTGSPEPSASEPVPDVAPYRQPKMLVIEGV